MIYENVSKLLRAAADSIDMQGMYGITDPVCKINGEVCSINTFHFGDISFDYDFPVSVVKGRPVFAGDSNHYDDTQLTFQRNPCGMWNRTYTKQEIQNVWWFEFIGGAIAGFALALTFYWWI